MDMLVLVSRVNSCNVVEWQAACRILGLQFCAGFVRSTWQSGSDPSAPVKASRAGDFVNW